MTPAAALLEVHDLWYRYPYGTAALEGVSFSIQEKESVGLVGPNGAGKSTLLLHLNGLLPDATHHHSTNHRPTAHRPTAIGSSAHDGQGRGGGDGHGHPRLPPVRVKGLPTTKDNLATIRRQVGLLFQDPDDQLFCPTVYEDVAFGPLNQQLPRDEVLNRVRQSLAAVGLEGIEDRLPHHFSLGERRRICLAGVLACQPELLALDEPTANLDPRGRRALIDILNQLDCAKLIASHDLDMIGRLCTRVILLESGRVVADGPASEILNDTALLERHGL